MVGGMLETGYYHVLFELISQAKWSRWKRRHSRAFTKIHSLLHTSPALACVNAASLAAPTLPCFSSALGGGTQSQHTLFLPPQLKHGLPCRDSNSFSLKSHSASLQCNIEELALVALIRRRLDG